MNIFRKSVLLLVLSFIIFSIDGKTKITAATKTLHTTKEKTSAFVTPDGAVGSARTRVSITEKYTTSGKNATYKQRNVLIAYRITGPINPKIQSVKRNHINNSGSTIKNFTSWTTISTFNETGWKLYSSQKNTTSVTYAKSNSNKSNVTFTIGGSDYIVPYRTHSAQLALKVD